MAKTKAEKIADIELQLVQLENQKKKLVQEQKQQERKDRTKMTRTAQGYRADPHTLALSKGALIYHMTVVSCGLADSVLCLPAQKNTAGTPAERSTAHVDLPSQYQNHIPR